MSFLKIFNCCDFINNSWKTQTKKIITTKEEVVDLIENALQNCSCSITLFLSVFRCDSIDRLRSRLSLIENEISDTHKFKEFYQFTFNFAKNPGQKNLGKVFAYLYITLLMVSLCPGLLCFASPVYAIHWKGLNWRPIFPLMFYWQVTLRTFCTNSWPQCKWRINITEGSQETISGKYNTNVDHEGPLSSFVWKLVAFVVFRPKLLETLPYRTATRRRPE